MIIDDCSEAIDLSATASSKIKIATAPLRVYFPGLNELRALAALCVIPGHIEQMKQLTGLPYNYWFPIPGKLGVILFFALSGFLITTLLLDERAQLERVGLLRFYAKRILRIWPLYFLVMGGSILVLNKIPMFQIPALSNSLYEKLSIENILLLLLIMPNYINFVIPYASQLWSIGIEEQFYLVQPLFVRFVASAAKLVMFMAAIVLSREILYFVNIPLRSPLIESFSAQGVYFGCIAIGCLGAFACKSRFISLLHHRYTQAFALVAFVVGIVLINVVHDERVVDYRVQAIVFSIMIINAATNPTSPYNLRNRKLEYLGKISYGIYMYHIVCVGVGIALAVLFADAIGSIGRDLFLYGFTFASTILLAAFSYEYFECYFLKLKSRIGDTELHAG